MTDRLPPELRALLPSGLRVEEQRWPAYPTFCVMGFTDFQLVAFANAVASAIRARAIMWDDDWIDPPYALTPDPEVRDE